MKPSDSKQITNADEQPAQLALFVAEEDVARPEYNIGKWAGIIFTSPYAKDVSSKRSFAFKTTYEGHKADASVTITPLLDAKTPTVTTYKVYVALVQLWEQQGRDPEGRIIFSDRQIAAQANWPYSGVIAKRVKEHIQILHGTSLEWTLAYKRAGKDGKPFTERKVSNMHIIEDSSYVERSIAFGQEQYRSNHWVRLNSTTVQNMLARLEKPLNAKVLNSIQSPSSSNLYVFLENFLSSKPKWTRDAINLITIDLRMDGVRYERSNNRLEFLRKLKADLDGQPLVRGHISIEIRRNKADTDWQIVARKILPKVTARRVSGVKPINTPDEAELIAIDLIDQIVRQPNSGTPKQGYIAWLAQYVPEQTLREALSLAKSDYSPENTKKTLVAVFVAIAKNLAHDRKIKIPTREGK